MKDTSLQAYLAVYSTGKADTQRYKIYKFISDNPSLTRQQIANHTGIPINAVCPRVLELLKKRLVAESGKVNNQYKLFPTKLFVEVA
jgi:predicted transcriptional regulator